MFKVRHIDMDLNIPCEFRKEDLVCPKMAIAKIYTEDSSQYLCRYHLHLAREEYEIRREKEENE